MDWSPNIITLPHSTQWLASAVLRTWGKEAHTGKASGQNQHNKSATATICSRDNPQSLKLAVSAPAKPPSLLLLSTLLSLPARDAAVAASSCPSSAA